jgi:hypothetical protein
MNPIRTLILTVIIAAAACGGSAADPAPDQVADETADISVDKADAVSRPCYTTDGSDCGPNQFCHYHRGDGCGVAGDPGVCRARPFACPRIVEPVCSCDGVTYSNSCEAHQSGASIRSSVACP